MMVDTGKGYDMRIIVRGNHLTTIVEQTKPIINFYSRYDLELMITITYDLTTREQREGIRKFIKDYADVVFNIEKKNDNEQFNLF
jgi:hypothetical protein